MKSDYNGFFGGGITKLTNYYFYLEEVR